LKNKKKLVLENIQNLKDINSDILAKTDIDTDEILEVSKSRIGGYSRAIKEAIMDGDTNKLAIALSGLEKQVNQQAFAARILAFKVDDPNLRSNLLKMSNQLSKNIAQNLLSVLKQAMDNKSTKKQTLDLVDSVLSQINNTISEISKSVESQSPEQLIHDNSQKINANIAQIVKNVRDGNVTTLIDKMKSLKDRVEKQVELSGKIKDKASFDQNLQERMQKGIDDLNNNLLSFTQNVVAFKKGDTTVKPEIEKIAKDFIETSSGISNLAFEIKQAKEDHELKLQEQLRQEEERRRLEAIEKEKKLSEIPVGIKEVYIAAQEIEQISTQYEKDDTVVGQILENVGDLGHILRELASLAKIGTPRDIINKAKEIAGLVDIISKFIDDICKECPDKVLCRELKDYGQVTKNFSVQLKILAAVKGGQILDEDPDGIQSLIICSQGLAKNIMEIVKLSQISKLKRAKK